VNILIVTIGTAGDVYPFVGIARHLVHRGHEVRLASTERHRCFVEAAGVDFQEVPGVRTAADSPDFYHATRGMRAVAETMLIPAIKPVYDLVSALDPGKWAVLADTFCYGARIARERAGEPLTTGVVSPFGLRSLLSQPVTPGLTLPSWTPRLIRRGVVKIAEHLWDRLLCAPLNAFRKDLGMPPVRDVWYGWSLSPDRAIGLFPEWFAPKPADWPAQFVHGGFTVYEQRAQGELPAELQTPGNPLVAFCAGSAGEGAASFFQTAIEASRDRPWRAVLLGGDLARHPSPLPQNVLAFPYIPLSSLLPLCSTVVHHGGLGTLSLALACGVPQIVIPFGHDQFDNVARLQRLGVACAITGKSNRVSRLSAAIEATPGNQALRDKCREVADRVRPQAAQSTICEQLERDWKRWSGCLLE
jgi:UDP:flavonoid glycosyltransferase YjiC (YdhE family)